MRVAPSTLPIVVRQPDYDPSPMELTATIRRPPTPPGDERAAPNQVVSIETEHDIAFASPAPGEIFLTPSTRPRSLWFRMPTASNEQYLTIRATPWYGSRPNPVISVTNWGPTGPISHRVAQLGQDEYHNSIQISLYGLESGDLLQVTTLDDAFFDLHVGGGVLLAPPSADDRCCPTVVTAWDSSYHLNQAGSTFGATAAPGELVAGSPARRSVWFRWDLREPMNVVLNSKGAGFSTRFSVFGPGGAELCQSRSVPTAEPLVSVAQCALQLPVGSYEIVVDTVGDGRGGFRLWSTRYDPPVRVGAPSSEPTAAPPARGTVPASAAPVTTSARRPSTPTPLPGSDG